MRERSRPARVGLLRRRGGPAGAPRSASASSGRRGGRFRVRDLRRGLLAELLRLRPCRRRARGLVRLLAGVLVLARRRTPSARRRAPCPPRRSSAWLPPCPASAFSAICAYCRACSLFGLRARTLRESARLSSYFPSVKSFLAVSSVCLPLLASPRSSTGSTAAVGRETIARRRTSPPMMTAKKRTTPPITRQTQSGFTSDFESFFQSWVFDASGARELGAPARSRSAASCPCSCRAGP